MSLDGTLVHIVIPPEKQVSYIESKVEEKESIVKMYLPCVILTLFLLLCELNGKE